VSLSIEQVPSVGTLMGMGWEKRSAIRRSEVFWSILKHYS